LSETVASTASSASWRGAARAPPPGELLDGRLAALRDLEALPRAGELAPPLVDVHRESGSVFDWFATARWHACRIHQVGVGRELEALAASRTSRRRGSADHALLDEVARGDALAHVARATWTTRRRFELIMRSFAARSPRSIFFAARPPPRREQRVVAELVHEQVERVDAAGSSVEREVETLVPRARSSRSIIVLISCSGVTQLLFVVCHVQRRTPVRYSILGQTFLRNA
jgi:hypothetical protein